VKSSLPHRLEEATNRFLFVVVGYHG